MSNITEYDIYTKENFYKQVKKHVPEAKKSDTDRILLAFGLELINGSVMILRSENYKENLSPHLQILDTLNKFYNIDSKDENYIITTSDDYIWPWRDHEAIIDDLKNGKNKDLINRKYLKNN